MSLWEKYIDNTNFKKLDKDINVDTLIIGGGISGLTLLYYLKNKDNICLVDADKIGSGITKNTTGKLTYLQGAIYSDLYKNINLKTAQEYLKSQKDAINLIIDIINKEKINCDLEKVSSFAVADKNSDITKLEEEKNFLKEENIDIYDTKFNNFPAIKVKDTYVFNPIKYLNGLKKILKNKTIFEGTKVDSVFYQDGKYICASEDKKIIAKKVIVACHYPFFLLPFCLPLKSHIEKSFLIAWKVKENEKYSAITISNPGFSTRFYQDKGSIYKIGLASSHETAFKQDDKKNFLDVQNFYNIKDEDIVARWSNVDIITDDKLPYIGKLQKNFYLMTGFNTWGMTNSIIGAKLVSDLILGIKNNYEGLFSLKRNNFYKFKNFFINTLISSKAFIGSKLVHKSWYNDNIKFEKRNGKNVAIYIDEEKTEHVVYNMCPHMKCSLIFNEVEKTWDCPCHSSKFSIDGECVKGPSLFDISYKE